MRAKKDPTKTWGKRGPGALREALRLPDGRLLTATSGGLTTWDPRTGDALAAWSDAPAAALALAPDGARVAAAGDDGRLRVFDLAGAEQARWRQPPGEDAILRWDEALIVCTTEGLCACDPATGALRERWDAGPTWMLAAAGGRVLHGSSAGALRFSPGQARGDKLRAGEVTAVALHADGRAAVAVGRGLRTYDAALRETGRRSLPARVEALDLRRDGTVIAALEGGRVTIGEGKARALPGWLAKEASAGGWCFDRDGRHLTIWSGYHGIAEAIDLTADAALGGVGSFSDESAASEVAPRRVMLHALHGDGQSTSESAALFEAPGGRCLWRSAWGLPQGLIDADPGRGVIVAVDADVKVIDAASGAVAAIPFPAADDEDDADADVDDEDRVVIGVQVRRGKVVIELEDRALEVDFERNALVPVKRRSASKRR